MRALPLCAVAVAGLTLAGGWPSRAGPPQVNTAWLVYGHDAQLTNFVRSSTLSAGTVASLRLRWKAQLDGAVVASPLYAPAHSIGGVGSDLVFAETEAGTIYALSADDGSVLWQRDFGTVTTPGADETCGTYGFSSTGAIDLGRGLVYAISADGALHALDLASGAEAPGWPIEVTRARNRYEYVWGGLRILGDRLYLGVSSYCDQADPNDRFAEGRLLSINLDDPTDQVSFDPVQGDGNGGGIWGWGGVSVEPDGSAIYTGVGNSFVLDPSCVCYVDTAGYAEQMLKLTPGLQVLSSDRPAEVPSTGDADFGSAPILFQPPGCRPYAAANSKLGLLYVWDRGRLERGPLVKFQLGDGIAAFVGAPSYSPDLRMLFEGHALVWRNGKHVGEGVTAISIDGKCRFHLQWTRQTGDGNVPQPLLVNDVVFSPGGDPGDFTALDARSGRELWTFSTDGAPTISPAIAVKNVVYAGDGAGVLRAFGR